MVEPTYTIEICQQFKEKARKAKIIDKYEKEQFMFLTVFYEHIMMPKGRDHVFEYGITYESYVESHEITGIRSDVIEEIDFSELVFE